MNGDVPQRFIKKLNSLNVSDYHGLTSPGLTCYLNSVLQVFFMTTDFRETIKRCSRKDSTAIEPHLRKLFESLEKNVAKTDHIASFLGITDVYKQRDAAEYFEKILCLTSPEASEFFKGELNHTTVCSRCGDRNEATSSFWILPLSVEDSRQTYSVEKGLEAFFEGQTVSGDNEMFCSRCDKKGDAFIKCDMTQTPEVLTLLLKRFHFDYEHMCYVKLHHKVEVPHVLRIQDCVYELYALINHSGNLTGGHYTAHIRSFDTGAWYDFNDGTVKLVKQALGGGSPVRSRTSYLLMYKKKRGRPEQPDEDDQESRSAGRDAAKCPGWRDVDGSEESDGRKPTSKRETNTKPNRRINSKEQTRQIKSRGTSEDRNKD